MFFCRRNFARSIHLYSRNHEWVFFGDSEASGVPEQVLVGLSRYAVESIGPDVVYVELTHQPSSLVVRNTPIGVVESVKGATDLFSPVSGRVLACNQDLIRKPRMLRTAESFDNAWLYRIAPSAFLDDRADLLTPAEYEEFCAGKK